MSAPRLERPPDVETVLAGLKDFQRRTVDYTFRRMYTDPDFSRRFLVADEVGLGKTMVARGLIARAIEHLWDQKPRIDILYICSNADIARQNIRRLNVTGQADFQLASRITLLPTLLGNLQANRLNFVSFTPGTSFELHSSMGTSTERAVLFNLLREAWGFRSAIGPLRVLQGDVVETESFRRHAETFKRRIEPTLKEAFLRALENDMKKPPAKGGQQLRTRFDELREKCARPRGLLTLTPENRQTRRTLIGDLRWLLARTCLDALEPDLIILDEFQRFKHLLDRQLEIRT